MPAPIIDEFSRLPISRQAKYARRKQAANCCRICGKPGDWLCVPHRAKQSQYNMKAQTKLRARNHELFLKLQTMDGYEYV